MTKQQTHYFESTGDAYDRCMTEEDIKTGDILIIESEKVVGLAWAWPIAVTKERGELHSHDHGVGGIHQLQKSGSSEYVFKTSQIAEACRIATDKGWDLNE